MIIMLGKGGNRELKDVMDRVCKVLIPKVSVDEVEVNQKFKRQYSVVTKNPDCLHLNPCFLPSLRLKFLIC
jgi:hypothetical protein